MLRARIASSISCAFGAVRVPLVTPSICQDLSVQDSLVDERIKNFGQSLQFADSYLLFFRGGV